jgi:transcriptional regulator with XRE-family HTH domain
VIVINLYLVEFGCVKINRDDAFLIRFGENIKALRQKHNFSQAALANLANIPTNQIGRIERGEVNTTINTILAIAEALKIAPKELFDC